MIDRLRVLFSPEPGDTTSVGTGGAFVTGGTGSGDCTITVTPSEATATWTLQGPLEYSYSGTGTETLTALDAGVYLLTWGAVVGYQTPTPDTGVVAAAGTLAFEATYRAVQDAPPAILRDHIVTLLEAYEYFSDFIIRDSVHGEPPAARWCENGYIEVDVDAEEEVDIWDDAFSELPITVYVRVFARHAERKQMKNLLIRRVSQVKEALASDFNALDHADVRTDSVRFGRVDYQATKDDDGLDIEFADVPVTAIYIAEPASRYAG